jgi:hypothetical protein
MRMGDTALPSVEKLMQVYLNPLLVDPARRPEERWVPLLVVSDCIEHAPASVKHLPSILPQLVTNAQSDRPELVQVCVYTLGVVAEKHPSVCISSCACPAALLLLQHLTCVLCLCRRCCGACRKDSCSCLLTSV